MTDYPQDPNQYPEYQQQYPQYPPPPEPKKSGAGKWIALGGIGCLFLLLLIAGGGYFFFTQLAKEEIEVVNQHLAAIKANDIDLAYSLCSSEFRNSTTREDFLSLIEEHPVLKNAKEFSSMNRSKEAGGTTVLKGAIEGASGEKLPAEFQLIKESSGWRIQYIKLSPAGVIVDQGDTANQNKSDTSKTQPSTETVPPPPANSNPEIINIAIEKTPEVDRIIVTIQFKVVKFATDKSQGSARIHLIQDLKTMDPQGLQLDDLSKIGIKELIESGEPDYTAADFTNTLTIPTSFPQGAYQAVLTVHDKIGGGVTTGTANFEIP